MVILIGVFRLMRSFVTTTRVIVSTGELTFFETFFQFQIFQIFFQLIGKKYLNKPNLCYSFRYANVELYIDDILVEKKAKSYEMKYTNWQVGFDLGYNVAEPLKIGSKIKLVWKGEPYTTSYSSTLKTASYRAEIARADMRYKFLGGKTLNYVQ